MNPLHADLQRLLATAPVVLVSVQQVQGSAPREVGAWMAVAAIETVNTLGGGHLEFEAIRLARDLLAAPEHALAPQRFALGPSLGQCCGGVVVLGFAYQAAINDPTAFAQLQARLVAAESPPMPIALFGGGHVGRALVHILSTLPVQVQWIDSRDEIFPAQVALNVQCEHSDPVAAAVADLAPRSRVLIMSFSHAEDLDVVAACLLRQRAQGDLPFIGLIGSKTKWASFRHRLQERGFAETELQQVTCPIGVAGINGKEPPVIAVAVVAQLLQTELRP